MDKAKKQIYSKTYYEKHKQRILNDSCQKVQCNICNSTVTKCHLGRHRKTEKCKLHLKINELNNNNIIH